MLLRRSKLLNDNIKKYSQNILTDIHTTSWTMPSGTISCGSYYTDGSYAPYKVFDRSYFPLDSSTNRPYIPANRTALANCYMTYSFVNQVELYKTSFHMYADKGKYWNVAIYGSNNNSDWEQITNESQTSSEPGNNTYQWHTHEYKDLLIHKKFLYLKLQYTNNSNAAYGHDQGVYSTSIGQIFYYGKQFKQ